MGFVYANTLAEIELFIWGHWRCNSMGSWGTGILSDDLAKDVYSDFMELYDDGLELSIIRKKVEELYTNLDDEELPVFYLALAKAQWECKALDIDIFNKVKEIIDLGIGLNLWEEAGKSTYNKRIKVLQEFLNKLSTVKEKPRRRNKIKKVEAIFEPGDCLVFNLLDGSYGGALVIGADNSHKTEGLNVIAILNIKSKEKPVINDFINAEVLRTRNNIYVKKVIEPIIANINARTHKKHSKLFYNIGNINIPKNFKLGYCYANWDYLIKVANAFHFTTDYNIVFEKNISVKQLVNRNLLQKIKGFLG